MLPYHSFVPPSPCAGRRNDSEHEASDTSRGGACSIRIVRPRAVPHGQSGAWCAPPTIPHLSKASHYPVSTTEVLHPFNPKAPERLYKCASPSPAMVTVWWIMVCTQSCEGPRWVTGLVYRATDSYYFERDELAWWHFSYQGGPATDCCDPVASMCDRPCFQYSICLPACGIRVLVYSV